MINSAELDKKYHQQQECFKVKWCSEIEFANLTKKYYEFYSNKTFTFFDVGCCSGSYHIVYDKFFEKITLADICDYRASEVKERFPFFIIDLSFPELPKGIGQYDFVNCLEVIEHIQNDAQAMLNLFKLVKPGGYLLLSTPNKLRASQRIKEFFGFPKKFPTSEKDGQINMHYREYSKDEIVNLVRKFNFVIKDVQLVISSCGHYHLLFPFLRHFFRMLPNSWKKNIIILAQRPVNPEEGLRI